MKPSDETLTTTVLAADIVGYSKLIGDDETATLEALRALMRTVVRPNVVRHGGRIFKFVGDAFLAHFPDSGAALDCAVRIQSAMTIRNASIPLGRKLFFRMGLHYGEVSVEGEDILGDTVNIAARLEGIAESGGIALSSVLASAIGPSVDFTLEPQGAHALKNIAGQIDVYRVAFDPAVFAGTEPTALLRPYRGLSAFREEDAPIFFGRESFVEQLADAVGGKSLVAVIGSSGSGKSSVVAAGLLPRMRRAGYLIAQFRPGSRPFVELATALQPLLLPDISPSAQRSAAQSLAETLASGGTGLKDLCATLQRRYPDASGVLLVADQFEEFLTLCTDRLARELFQDTLISGLAAIDAARARGEALLPMVVVTTLRADFMGRMLEYRPLADAIQDGDVKLGPMTREELRRTIESPAQQQGVGYASGLVERILDDVGDEPGNLPLLQFALTALWERDAELGAELSHQAYDRIGRVQGALAHHADEVLASLQPSEQELARRIFVQLVQPGEGISSTRRVATRAELGEDAWRLVQRLADARLVITGRNTVGEETAEVVHEALIRDWGALKGWLSEDFAFRSWQERLRGAILQWRASEEDDGGLLRGAALAESIGWTETHGDRLGEAERDYIERAREQLEAQKRLEQQQLRQQVELRHSRRSARRFKGFAVALAAVLTVAVGAAALAWTQRQSALELQRVAEHERQLAQSARERTAQALEIAESARADAEAARASVESAKTEVDVLNRQILSQQLAAEATLANDNPGDRAIGLPLLLGIEAVNTTLAPDGHSLLVASNALRQAVRHAPDRPWRRLAGHTGRIEAAHFSADGSRFVTGGNDTLVKIWDVASGALLHALDGHQQRVTQARFSPDGSRVLSTSMDGTLRIWRTADGALERTISDHDGAVYDVVVSADGKRWATVSYDGSARILDAASGETLHVLEGQEEPLYVVSFSPDGRRIGTAGDISAFLWDAQSGELIRDLQTGITAVRTMEFTADSRLLVVRGEDNHADVRLADTGERHYVLDGHDGAAIWSAMFSPDDRWLLSAGGDGTLRTWESDTGRPARTYFGHDGAVARAVYSPDGSLIASAGGDGAALVWEADSARVIGTLEGHESAVSTIVFGPDGGLVATTGDDGVAALWRLSDVRERATSDAFTIAGHAGGGQTIAFSPNEPLVASGGYNGEIVLTDTLSGQSLAPLPDTESSTYALDISPDGEHLVATGGSGNVSIWELATRTLVHRVPVAGSANIWVEYDPSGTLILTTSVDGTASLVDARRGEVIHTLEGHEGALFWAGFTPDGRLAVTASYADNTARVWDVESGNTIHVLRGHSGSIYRCGLSPDGRYLVTASNDTTAKVWDLRSGDLVRELQGHTSTVRAAAFSPDGRLIVTASYDMTAKVWSAVDGRLLHTLTGHQGSLMSIAFVPGHQSVLTTSSDTTAKLWDLDSGFELHSLEGHSDKLEFAAVSPDGRRIVTQGQDDTPRLWYARVEDLLAVARETLPRERAAFTTAELRRFRLGDMLRRRERAEALIAEGETLARTGELARATELFARARAADDSAVSGSAEALAVRARIAALEEERLAYESGGEREKAERVLARLTELRRRLGTIVEGAEAGASTTPIADAR